MKYKITLTLMITAMLTLPSLSSTVFAETVQPYRLDIVNSDVYDSEQQAIKTRIAWDMVKAQREGNITKVKLIIAKEADGLDEEQLQKNLSKQMQDILSLSSRLRGMVCSVQYGYSSKITAECLSDNEKVIMAWLELSKGTAEMQNESLEKVKELANKARQHSANPKEQLRYINDYLVYNVEYDNYASDNIDKVDDTSWTAYGALVNGKAVCAGYSNVVTLVCEELGIPVIEVYGNDHEWNMVYIGNNAQDAQEWKHLDVTWNDPTWNSKPSKSEIDNEKEVYFLKTEEQFIRAGHEKTSDNIQELIDTKYPELKNIEKTDWDGKVLEALTEPTKPLTKGALAEIVARTEGMMLLERNKDRYIKLATKTFNNLNSENSVYVGYLLDRGILEASDEKSFGGNVNMTKEELNIALSRMKGVEYKGKEKSNTSVRQLATYADLVNELNIPDKQIKFISE